MADRGGRGQNRGRGQNPARGGMRPDGPRNGGYNDGNRVNPRGVDEQVAGLGQQMGQMALAGARGVGRERGGRGGRRVISQEDRHAKVKLILM